MARLLAMRKMMKLETMGLKRKGRSVYAIIKEEFGLKGNKQRVYEQFSKIVTDITGIKERFRQ